MLLTVQSIMSRKAGSEAVSKEDQRCPNISFLIFIEVVEIESLVRLLCMSMQANSWNVSLATPPDAPQLDSCSRVSIQKRLACSYVKGQCVPSPILEATNK